MAKKTPAKTAKKAHVNVELPRGKLIRVPLRQIDAESFPNQRTGDFTLGTSKDSGEDQSFSELVDSLTLTGQKEPVTARPRPDDLPPSETGATLQLVAGFRRHGAIMLIGQRGDSDNYLDTTYIDVIVKDLTDLEALEENIFENSARDNLTGPDLAWAAYNLQQHYKSQGVIVPDIELAKRMGKNQSHISKIKKIVASAPVIAKLWQKSPSPLTVEAMKALSELPPDQQESEYLRINAELGGKGNRRGIQRPPLETATNQAKRIATMLGALELQELITSHIDWFEDLAAIGVKVDDLTATDKRKVATEAEKAFNDAKTVKPAKDPKEPAKTTEADPPQATA